MHAQRMGDKGVEVGAIGRIGDDIRPFRVFAARCAGKEVLDPLHFAETVGGAIIDQVG